MRALLAATLMMIPAVAIADERVIGGQPSADDIQSELFGAHLFGVVGIGEHWNECIEPDGDTLYTIGDVQEKGKAWVPQDGEICFNYGGPDHCFSVYRSAKGFVLKGGGSTWQTNKIRENVDVCLLSDMIG